MWKRPIPAHKGLQPLPPGSLLVQPTPACPGPAVRVSVFCSCCDGICGAERSGWKGRDGRRQSSQRVAGLLRARRGPVLPLASRCHCAEWRPLVGRRASRWPLCQGERMSAGNEGSGLSVFQRVWKSPVVRCPPCPLKRRGKAGRRRRGRQCCFAMLFV